jgi:hypothetical protein
MSDKGIQIIVALLEKRESFLLTKDTDSQLAKELLRAETLGFVQREQKTALYTLSEKGRMLVYSGYRHDELPPSPPPVPSPIHTVAAPAVAVIQETVNTKGDLRPAYTSALLITALFLLTILVLWLRDLI